MELTWFLSAQLKQVIEDQLLLDLTNYSDIDQTDIYFDWSDNYVVEGKSIIYLDSCIDKYFFMTMSNLTLNFWAEGYVNCLLEEKFFLAYWDDITIHLNNSKIYSDKFGIPEHIWNQIPAALQPKYYNQKAK
jgi:hypothetical protein